MVFDPAASTQPHERLFANQVSEGLRKGKYMLFDRPSPLLILNSSGAIPALYTAVAAQVDAILVPDAFGNQYIEMYQTTAQALPPVHHATKGITIGGDLVDNESVEYVPGGNRTTNPLGYTAGTDPGVFIRAIFEIADASGSDQFGIGFRKQEAYVVPTSFLSTGDALYTDFAMLGFSGTAAANLVKSMTDLNNAGSTVVTSSAFAWADGTIHQLEVRIKGRVVSYFINGRRVGETVKLDGLGADITDQPTTALPSFTFDTGDFLIPFIFHRYDTTTPGAVYLRHLEVGQLLEVGLQPEGR